MFYLNPNQSPLFHIRFAIAILLLLQVDIMLLYPCFSQINAGQNNAFISIYGFELCILFLDILTTSANYIVGYLEYNYLYDHPDEIRWPKRGISLFLTKFISHLLKLGLFAMFSIFLLVNYCFPVHIFPEAYTTLRILISRTRGFIRYKRQLVLSSRLKNLPLATEEDITKNDSICIICRDNLIVDENHEDENEYKSQSSPVLLPCHHVLHYDCLNCWFEKSSSCPHCRCLFWVNKSYKTREVPVH